MASIGFFFSQKILRQVSVNARPSLMSSRYMQMTLVCGSSLRYWRRSTSLRSALLPKLTNFENPRLCMSA